MVELIHQMINCAFAGNNIVWLQYGFAPPVCACRLINDLWPFLLLAVASDACVPINPMCIEAPLVFQELRCMVSKFQRNMVGADVIAQQHIYVVDNI